MNNVKMKNIEKQKYQQEVDDNYEKFKEVLPELLKNEKKKGKEGRYVLMKKKKILSYHDSFVKAQEAGEKKCPDGLFSIQKIDEHIVNLGYFSYA